MGWECSENFHSINRNDFTVKQMFDISEKLINGQSDEIYGVTQLIGKFHHGNNYLLSVMKKSSVSRTRKVTYFHILCYALER